jgi:MoxR-like ATPase
MDKDIKALNDRVRGESELVRSVLDQVGRVIVGQAAMVERLLIGLLTRGHILLEGVPGLAKTLAVKTLADVIEAEFKRIQFTPDLLPADLIGTLIFHQKDGSFVPRKGPIFANLILADEINRAPAKVQSALLEAMQERQVTIGDSTYALPEPFLVLATQNPIEQEGTYPLPEAQVDRFMLKLKIGYPSKAEERAILERMVVESEIAIARVLEIPRLLKAREVVDGIYVDERVKDYILDLVFATRDPKAYKLELSDLIAYGASPRATLYLARAAKAHAFLRGRGYVTPEDVKAIGMDVLRHRVLLTYEAEAEQLKPEDIIRRVFDAIEIP